MKQISTIKPSKSILLIGTLLPMWYLIYHYLQPISDWLVDSVIGMQKGDHLTETIRFFIFEVPKVLMLLALIIFIVGIIRTYFSAERTRKMLEGKSTFAGNVLASMLGIVTPSVHVLPFRYFLDL